jgi:Ca-activated chloride channel family protein
MFNMKRKNVISLFLAFCLFLSLISPAWALEAVNTAESISEKEFALLLMESFPDFLEASTMMSDLPVTYGRALELLCGALGHADLSNISCLAFAIENDLITGIAAVSSHEVSKEEAKRLVAAFVSYRDTQLVEAVRDAVSKITFTSSIMMPQMAVQSSGQSADASMPASFPYVDYNGMNDESYGNEAENRFLTPLDSPFSTFSLDVDTASYANIRRCLLGGYMPDKGAIRIEEMLNYFDYNLPESTAGEPISVATELAVCPWNKDHQLAMIALSGYEPDKAQLPGSNLVFLVDVSGSMEAYNRLPLLRKALKLLVSQLGTKDRVTIVTYAGSAGVLLDTTAADQKEMLLAAIDSMNAGGATNGAGGITIAYEKAGEAFIPGGNNRVILLTDGDFNVGVQSASELEALITEKRESGIYLSVLGFGMGNLKDYEMETLADCGNGNYAYIDTLKEAKKVLVDDMTGTIFTIAKDVKLQVEFNPRYVASYRLIGYENRLLNTEDFLDDKKDAGEMGAGHQMIALYEIIPAASEESSIPVAESRYQKSSVLDRQETLYVSVRYKLSDSGKIMRTESVLKAGQITTAMSCDMAFASAVAEFGLILKDSPYKGDASLDSLIGRALLNRETDAYGYRAEFVQLADLTRLLQDNESDLLLN